MITSSEIGTALAIPWGSSFASGIWTLPSIFNRSFWLLICRSGEASTQASGRLASSKRSPLISADSGKPSSARPSEPFRSTLPGPERAWPVKASVFELWLVASSLTSCRCIPALGTIKSALSFACPASFGLPTVPATFRSTSSDPFTSSSSSVSAGINPRSSILVVSEPDSGRFVKSTFAGSKAGVCNIALIGLAVGCVRSMNRLALDPCSFITSASVALS